MLFTAEDRNPGDDWGHSRVSWMGAGRRRGGLMQCRLTIADLRFLAHPFRPDHSADRLANPGPVRGHLPDDQPPKDGGLVPLRASGGVLSGTASRHPATDGPEEGSRDRTWNLPQNQSPYYASIIPRNWPGSPRPSGPRSRTPRWVADELSTIALVLGTLEGVKKLHAHWQPGRFDSPFGTSPSEVERQIGAAKPESGAGISSRPLAVRSHRGMGPRANSLLNIYAYLTDILNMGKEGG